MAKKMPMTVGVVRPVIAAQPQMQVQRPVSPVPPQPMVRAAAPMPPHVRAAPTNLMALSQAARLAEALKRMK